MSVRSWNSQSIALAMLLVAGLSESAAQAQYVGVLGTGHAGAAPRTELMVRTSAPVSSHQWSAGSMSLPSSALPTSAEQKPQAPESTTVTSQQPTQPPAVTPVSVSRRRVLFSVGEHVKVKVQPREHTLTQTPEVLPMGGY